MKLITEAGRFTGRPDADPHWIEHLWVPELSAGTYSLPAGATDDQKPHTEDEVYVVMSGRATLTAGGDAVPVGPGSVVYVPAGEEHRFTGITEDLAALVLFAPGEESRSGRTSEA